MQHLNLNAVHGNLKEVDCRSPLDVVDACSFESMKLSATSDKAKASPPSAAATTTATNTPTATTTQTTTPATKAKRSKSKEPSKELKSGSHDLTGYEPTTTTAPIESRQGAANETNENQAADSDSRRTQSAAAAAAAAAGKFAWPLDQSAPSGKERKGSSEWEPQIELSYTWCA